MRNIPFTKVHGAKNDFLLTWAADAPETGRDEIARRICERHTGIGADGWMLVQPGSQGHEHASIQLYNSDGSTSEISGNGTRCVAAWLVHAGLAGEDEVRIQTGAGLKTLRLIANDGLTYHFEMDMGRPAYNEKVRQSFSAGADKLDVTILDVGNPQCVVFVENFTLDWRQLGALIERHPEFPNRTNVSFVRSLDRHSIEVRFWERGAGETMSSGTGSTGAAFAAILRDLVESPVRVLTAAGELTFRLANSSAYLSGPAELIANGEYFVRR